MKSLRNLTVYQKLMLFTAVFFNNIVLAADNACKDLVGTGLQGDGLTILKGIIVIVIVVNFVAKLFNESGISLKDVGWTVFGLALAAGGLDKLLKLFGCM